MSSSQASIKPRKTRQERLRSGFLLFTSLNSLSFMLLSGSILTLFSLSLGASGTYIGLLGSLNFITYFFMPLGRHIIRRRSIVKVFGWAWMLRYWGMIPALFAPILAWRGAPGWGLVLLFGSSLLFNIFRGIGLIGNNPILGMLAGDRNRGAFLSNVQISNSMTAIVTSAASMLVLWKFSGNILYGSIMALGIIIGSIASAILFGFPEPEAYKPKAGSSFLASVKEAWKDKPLRRFITVFALLSFSAGTARTFIVTHASVLYAQNPGLVMAYSVAFNLGSVAAGYLSRKLMDRLGAKPLYVVFIVLAFLAMLPVVWSPAIESALLSLIFLAALNFIIGMGIIGQENAGQAYFFSIVSKEHMVDLAIMYFMIFGFGGALGSTAGGVFLDFLSAAGFSARQSYQLLYLISVAFTLFGSIGALKLNPVGAATVKESLSVLFSMRDIKAIGVLEKLERSGTPADEIRLIRELGTYGVAVAGRELLSYLGSPRLDVRIEALLALENLDKLSVKAMRAITKEIEKHPYTTAYVAARILGKHGFLEGLPSLRMALHTDDYMLQGSAMIALAAMADDQSLESMEKLVEETENPRLLIMAASAIEKFGKTSSIPSLVTSLKRINPPPYAFDEIVLALSGILGGLGNFYSLYSEFSHDPEAATAKLLEPLEEVKSGSAEHDQKMKQTAKELYAFIKDGSNRTLVGRAIAASVIMDMAAVLVLSEAAINTDLCRYMGFRFFLVACAIEALLHE
ncbi:MFS transporter [Spirochaetota bacterium]